MANTDLHPGIWTSFFKLLEETKKSVSTYPHLVNQHKAHENFTGKLLKRNSIKIQNLSDLKHSPKVELHISCSTTFTCYSFQLLANMHRNWRVGQYIRIPYVIELQQKCLLKLLEFYRSNIPYTMMTWHYSQSIYI